MNEQAQTKTVDTEQEQGVTFEQLEAALAGNPATPAETQEPIHAPEVDAAQSDVDAPAEIPESYTAKQLAERLEIKPSELYKNLQIDVGNDQTLSLGEIKDRAKELVQSEALRAEALSARESGELELLQKSQALVTAQQQAGIEVSPEMMEYHAEQVRQYAATQDRIFAQLQPGLGDEVARTEANNDIAKVWADLGFSKPESGVIADARLRVLALRYSRLKADIDGVAGTRKRGAKDQKPRVHTKTGNDVTQINSQLGGGKLTQRQAVDQLGKLLEK